MNAQVQLRSTTRAGDLLELTKPGIIAMTALTAAGGLGLAPDRVGSLRAVAALVGTALCVASANVFNMYLERDNDRWMSRTASRPLPQGRINPLLALTFGAALGLIAVAVLSALVRPVTAVLGALGFLVYVFFYTPLKKLTPHALLVGCVAGAIPPAMGWSAATGSIDARALALPLVLFAWQIPHFLAISVFRKKEYARAEIRAAAVVWSERTVRLLIVASSALLLIVSLAPIAAGIAGLAFGLVAAGAGTWMVVISLARSPAPVDRWARRVFRASLVYLPLLALGMIVDVIAR